MSFDVMVGVLSNEILEILVEEKVKKSFSTSNRWEILSREYQMSARWAKSNPFKDSEIGREIVIF